MPTTQHRTQIPAHLTERIRSGLILAASIAADDDLYERKHIRTLAEEWGLTLDSRLDALLTPSQAAELRAIIVLAAEHAFTHGYDQASEAKYFPEDYAFAKAAEEIIFQLNLASTVVFGR